MSRSHGRATAQNFAEFAQNLEICTPKLKNSCIFTIFTCFCTFYVTFLVFVMHFLAQLFQKLSSDRAKKSTFRMSALRLQLTDFGWSGGKSHVTDTYTYTLESQYVTMDRFHAKVRFDQREILYAKDRFYGGCSQGCQDDVGCCGQPKINRLWKRKNKPQLSVRNFCLWQNQNNSYKNWAVGLYSTASETTKCSHSRDWGWGLYLSVKHFPGLVCDTNSPHC